MAKNRKIGKATLDKYKSIIDLWFTNEFNGKEAYLKFYPKSKDLTARANFSKLCKIKEVSAYIEKKKREAAKYIDVTHKGMLEELKRYIEADLIETIGLSKEELKELPIELRRMVTKHKEKTRSFYSSDGKLLRSEKVIELHFFSKEKVAEMINKHIGFYEADNEQKAANINITTTNEKHKELVESIVNGKG